MADTLDSYGNYIPKDLLNNTSASAVIANSVADKDKAIVTVDQLKIGTKYSFQFQYVFQDGTVSAWSPGYSLTTASYATKLTKPTITITAATLGYTVSYTKQTDPNFAYAIIEEVVSNSNTAPSSGWTEAAVTSSNPVTITIGNTNKRWVRVKLVDRISGDSPYSDPVAVTPVDPVAEATDSVPPDAIQSATAVGSADTTDTSGISGTITISVVNSISACPSDFAGYVVKIVRASDSKEWTQSFSSKTYLTTLNVKLGIIVGQSYTLSIKTTDGRNDSSYVNVTGNPISVSDSRTNSSIASSLILSATDSILTVSWTAPNDVNVDSYRVQLTSDADTTFATPLQQIYVKSNTVSFGGLSASTTYRIRVTSKYSGSTGPLSTNHLTGIATLNASGAISDGIAPTTNPTITTNNIKSLFGAFAITFPSVTNTDAVTYEVFIKPTDSTGIVSNTYKVLEVSGTFAVIKTLADKTTALSYGTNYYIAIRAKDNDGVSTGTVTAVGPVQTLQVQNADLAADSVYANNIKAGEIDASKMTTDLLFTNKTINVGQSTSLNRVRLDGTSVTLNDYPSGTFTAQGRIFIGAGNYFSSGTSFYADNTGRLSIGDKLRFDGTNLTVNGSGNFSGLLTTGAGSQVIKVGTGANGANNGIYVGATGDYIYTDGTFQFGAGAITGSASSLSVKGELEVKGSSRVVGDLQLDPSGSGVFYIGSNKTIGGFGDKIIFNSNGIAAYPSYNATPTFQLAKDGTGKIGGWTINQTSLSSGGMTLNSNNQTISFTSGFIIDNTNYTYTYNTGATTSSLFYGDAADTDTSVYVDGSWVSLGTDTISSSSLAIKPSGTLTSASPALLMSTSGYSTLQAGGSYITLSSGGIVLNTNTVGGITFSGFANTPHYTYSGKESGAVLQVFSNGKVTAGRSFYKSGATESRITSSAFQYVGLIGDIIFSTAD